MVLLLFLPLLGWGSQFVNFESGPSTSAIVQLEGQAELERYLHQEIWKLAVLMGTTPPRGKESEKKPYFDLSWLLIEPKMTLLDFDPTYDQIFNFHHEVLKARDRMLFLTWRPLSAERISSIDNPAFETIWKIFPGDGDMAFVESFPKRLEESYRSLWAWLNLLDLSCVLVLEPPIAAFNAENFDRDALDTYRDSVSRPMYSDLESERLAARAHLLDINDVPEHRVRKQAAASLEEVIKLYRKIADEVAQLTHPLLLHRPELHQLLATLEQNPMYFAEVIEHFAEHLAQTQFDYQQASAPNVVNHPRRNQILMAELKNSFGHPLVSLFSERGVSPLIKAIEDLQARAERSPAPFEATQIALTHSAATPLSSDRAKSDQGRSIPQPRLSCLRLVDTPSTSGKATD